jgi:hypothetical protein
MHNVPRNNVEDLSKDGTGNNRCEHLIYIVYHIKMYCELFFILKL